MKKIIEIRKIIKKHKVKKIFLGCDPNPTLSNILKSVSNLDIKIMGCQHGGGYIVQNYDKEHIDSDYNFCDYFISYATVNNSIIKLKKNY